MEKRNWVTKMKEGFQGPFWVANIMELFERLAYYGQATILSIYLRDHLKFNEMQAGQLSSIFGGLIYLLPIFAGALADKYGFRRAFAFAFLVLAIGYFLIGSTGMQLFSGFYSNFNLYWMMTFIVILTAIGGSFIKPSVLGTVALTSAPEVRSLGFAIYYWLVNMGAAIGPMIAFFVRDAYGIEFVFLVSAISCALMFISTLAFYKEPASRANEKRADLKVIFRNLLLVLKNKRVMPLLLIFALYWIMFWQFFIVIPFYLVDYISALSPVEIIISIGAWTILIFQIPVNRLTKGIPTTTAIIIGFVMAVACWLLWFLVLPITYGVDVQILGNTVHLSTLVIALGIIIFSLGEQTQAPRFYEYIADIAPPGQAGLFQGYAFLPVAIAWAVGGTLGGWLYKTYGISGANKPEMIFLVLMLIGVVATIAMVLYAIYVKRLAKK